MKKAMLLLLPLLAVCWLAIILPACHKDDGPYVVPPDLTPKPDTLPALTTIGANTFGCKVNGKVWVVKAGDPVPFDPEFRTFSSSITEGPQPNGGYITVKKITENLRQTISFGVQCKSGIYYTNKENAADLNQFYIWIFDYLSNRWYYPDDTGINTKNRLNISYLDTLNNVMSGSFEFTLFRQANNGSLIRSDSLVITDGRFDIRYSN